MHRTTELRERLESALAKPSAEIGDIIDGGFFSPWEDVFPSIYGHYSSASDALMIDALIAVRDKKTFEFIDERGFVGEFALYILAGHGLIEYGTSPRGGWPDYSIEELWQPLIDKWVEYYEAVWGRPYQPPESE